MSDTAKRDAVLEEFAHDAGVHRVWGVAGMADEILRLRAENAALRAEIDRLNRIQAALSIVMADRIVELEAAVERVRALHHNRVRGAYECAECLNDYPCPTLRALEGMP